MIDKSFLIPVPRTESPLDAPALGWGIIGPGRIASAFAESLAAHTRQRIVAIGSRSIDTALNFAKRFHGCDAVRSYEELVNHPAIDHRLRQYSAFISSSMRDAGARGR